MKIEVSAVKGFQDYLPPESLKRDAVKKVIETWFKRYGFIPIETPIIEFDELMKSDSIEEDEAVSDRFRLRDRAGRNLGLRYEFTFQLARIFKQNPFLKLPFRRYQIGEVFRDEPTGTNRFRQFVQCDADIIGDETINAELDCLMLASDILKELNIEYEITINSRRLINSIIESVEIPYPENVMRELDKLYKIGEDAVKVNLKKYSDANRILTLFKLLEKDLKFFVENAFDGAKELNDLIKKCEKTGIKLKFSPNMMRGLSYYTGAIFEIKQTGKNSIASGGRYDKIVGKYLPQKVTACGISFGLERVTELSQIEISSTKALLISIEQYNETQKLARRLRKENISCIVSTDKIGKAMEYANSIAMPYVIFIGKDEVEQEKYKLKNMKTGEEKLLSDKQIIKKLSF